MKKTAYTLFALLAGAGAWTITNSTAQPPGRPAGGPPFFANGAQTSGRPAGRPPAFVQALPEIYAVLALADINGDNQLDADEQALLLSAMEDGTLTKPEWLPTPPVGANVPHEAITQRMAGVYGVVAPFDTDDNGELVGRELGQLRAAAISGEIALPFGGPGRPGGAQFGRPFGPPQGVRGGERPEETPAFVENLPTAFAILSAADEDQDGTLNADEQVVLVEAIEDGTITKPDGLPTAPEGVNPTTENVVKRLAVIYARLQGLDTNENGLLEEAELSTLRDRSQRPGRPQPRIRPGRPENTGRSYTSPDSSRNGKKPSGVSRGNRPQR